MSDPSLREGIVKILKELQLDTMAVQTVDKGDYDSDLDYLTAQLHWAEVQIERLLDRATVEARQLTTANYEVKAKIEALDKLILGAGEYHDDPYEYVVPLRHIQAYRADLMKFDLSQPIFKDDNQATLKAGTPGKKGAAQKGEHDG